MDDFLETIKAVDGEILHIKYHQKRYEDVMRSFGHKEFKNLSDYLNPPKFGVYKCRLIYNKENDIDVSYDSYKKRGINSFKLVFDNNIEYSKKSLSRTHIEKLYEKRDDCDEILIIKNLLVTDTSIANIAFYVDGVWMTPKNPLLKGTTRERLLDEGKIIEADIKTQHLRKFTSVALLNAMVDFDILESFEFVI